MERDQDRAGGVSLLNVMVTARLGGPALRQSGEDRPAIRNDPPPPAKAGLWERLGDWLRLF